MYTPVFYNTDLECIEHSLDRIKLIRDTFFTFNSDGDYFWGSRSIRMLDLLLIEFRLNSGNKVDRIIELKKFWYCSSCADGHFWISILKLFQSKRRTLFKFIMIENDLKEDFFLFDKLIEWIWVFPILYRYSNSII